MALKRAGIKNTTKEQLEITSALLYYKNGKTELVRTNRADKIEGIAPSGSQVCTLVLTVIEWYEDGEKPA